MKTLNLALATALSAFAFGAQAQTIETGYPAVQPGSVAIAQTGGQSSTALSADSASADVNREPLLIQSNYAGPVTNPVYAETSTRTRAEVRAEAQILVPRSPGLNA